MGRDTSPCGRFAEGHGTGAVALGRTAGELLGVHPVVGTIRVDCCGALMLSSAGRVTQVEAGLIRYNQRACLPPCSRTPSICSRLVVRPALIRVPKPYDPTLHLSAASVAIAAPAA
jgi:hypothetical protein